MIVRIEEGSSWLRKRRVRKHVIADLSINHVERYALTNGFPIERVTKDYGYDLIVFTYNLNGEFEPGSIYIQIKATDKLKTLKGKKVISIVVDKRDLIAWLHEMMPVILIVYDAASEKAYWIHVQQYLKELLCLICLQIKKSIHLEYL